MQPDSIQMLTRKEAAEYLTRRGCRISASTLANMAKTNGKNSGKGPSLYKDGETRVLYSPTDLDTWRVQRLRRIEFRQSQQ